MALCSRKAVALGLNCLLTSTEGLFAVSNFVHCPCSVYCCALCSLDGAFAAVPMIIAVKTQVQLSKGH